MSYTKLLDTALWWSVTLLVSSFYIYGSNIYGKYLMMILTIIIGGLCVLRYGKNLNIHITTYHMSVLAFGTFALLSTLWAQVPDASLEKGLTIFQILICMSVVYIYADHLPSTIKLLDSIRWAGYLMTLYLLAVYGWGQIQILLEEAGRIDSELINANVIGMICAFSLILTVYKIMFFKFSIWHLLALPEIAILSVSNSRKAFVLLVLGCALVVAMKYLKRNIISILSRGFVILIVLFGVSFLLLSLPMFEGMKHRLEGLLGLFSSSGIADSSATIRKYMVMVGFEQFLQTPFLGIGIGNSPFLVGKMLGRTTYLHNNWIEMLACGGITGTLTYYFMFFYPGIQLFKQRYNLDKNTLICLILLVLLLLMDWGYVSYYSKFTYFFVLVFFIQVKLNKQEGKNNVSQN